MADSGRVFCQGCHTLEGNSPLVFTAMEALKRISQQFGQDNVFARVEKIVDKVVVLICEAKDHAAVQKNDLQEELDAADLKVNQAQDKLNDAKAEEENARGVTVTANGRRRQASSKLLDDDKVAGAVARVTDAKDNLTKLNVEKKKIQENLSASLEKFNSWLSKFPHQTREELIQHARSVQQPGIDYFNKQFEDPAGDLFKFMQVLDCCNTIFNPLWLKTNAGELHNIKMRAQELLPFFEFPEFHEDFIQAFLEEIPQIVSRATDFIFDWDEIAPSHLFKTRLEKKKKRMEAQVDEDWRKDPGEKATRIWEWWKPVVVSGEKFPCFSLALRLIGLLQVSSCAVERVFSQMKCVIDVCGHVHEDLLEVRMNSRCNGDLDPVWTQACAGNV